MPAMSKDGEIGRRIKRLRIDILDISSQAEFAEKIGGVTRGAVGNWERGEGIKVANIQRISSAFNVSFDWLSTGRGEPLNGALTTPFTKSVKTSMAPIKGFVEAGHWQEVESGGTGEMPEYVPSSGEYPPEWQYAFIVHGESVNRVAKDGERLICLDLIKSQVEIEDGDLVVVERTRFDGQMIERTAKRVKRTLTGLELWPDSDHPNHQTPVSYRPDGDPDHNSVVIIAKVLWVLKKP